MEEKIKKIYDINEFMKAYQDRYCEDRFMDKVDMEGVHADYERYKVSLQVPSYLIQQD